MDRRVFEALASETRIDILKKLDARQMTISELSREMEMAKSSIHEHLAKMVESGLVEKFDKGHKWTYYYLTRKGRNILHPHEATKILVLLGLSLLAITSGISNFINVLLYGSAAAPMSQAKMTVAEAADAALAGEESAIMSEAPRAVEPALTSEPFMMISAVLIAIGIIIALIAYKMWSRGRPKKLKQNTEEVG